MLHVDGLLQHKTQYTEPTGQKSLPSVTGQGGRHGVLAARIWNWSRSAQHGDSHYRSQLGESNLNQPGRDSYQVSIIGRFFPSRGFGFGAEVRAIMIHSRLVAGSMTSSISKNVAVLTALPFS